MTDSSVNDIANLKWPSSELVFVSELGEQIPSCGTLERLVHYLTYVALEDAESLILHKFLVSFRQITSAQNLFRVVENLYQQSQKKRRKKIPSIKPEGVCAFLQRWVSHSFRRDFQQVGANSLYKDLLALLDVMSKKHQLEANRVKLLLLKSGTDKASDSSTNTTEAEPESSNPSDARAKAALNFFDMNITEVAETMTEIEAKMFNKISSDEFLNMAWRSDSRDETAPNVVAMVERFNMVSYWVATEIVMLQNPKQRVQIIKKFIMLAEKCLEYSNFNTVMEILGGMNNIAVQRLKKTWEDLPEKYHVTLDELNDLMEPKQNYKKYRDTLTGRKLPALPYLGITLRDLTFIEEGNANKVGEGELLNFQKLMMIGGVILELDRFNKKRYTFRKDSSLTQYLTKLIKIPDEVLYKQSLEIEPSVVSKKNAS